jgi:hypothetical protein
MAQEEPINANIFKTGYKFVSSSIKATDIYGVPISLKLNGKETFKTFIGGCTSLLMLMLIFTYSVFQLYLMFSRGANSITAILAYRDLSLMETGIDMKPLGFEIGIFADTSKNYEDNILLDPTYFDTKFVLMSKYMEDGISVRKNEEYTMERWNYTYPSHYTDKNTNQENLDEFYWANADEYPLQGNHDADKFKNIKITIDKCSGDSWKTDAEIEAAMAATDVILTIPSFYFDTDSFGNPITVSKSFRMKYSLTTIFYQQVIVETSINTAETYDSYINTISPTNYEYMRVEDFYTKVLAPESTGIIEFKVALSLNTLKIERKVYSFYEILGQIGGVMAILLPSGALLSGLFSNKIYSMKMLI